MNPPPQAMSKLPSARSSPWLSRWEELLTLIHVVRTEPEVTELLQSLAQPQRPITLAFINAHAMNCAVNDLRFHAGLIAADHVLRDGSGMALLFKAMNRAPGLNLNGTDLIPRLMAHFASARIALYGTTEPFLSRSAEAIASPALAPQSEVTTANGFHEPQHYLQLAQQHRPGLIVLGMGMPKQEAVAALLREQLEHPCIIVCGGAILDFLGGKVTRAPRLLRSLGLEWVYRLAKEPKRLFSRYVIGNPVFIARTLRFAADQRQLLPRFNRAAPRAEAQSTRY